jgi:hypothetical protein
MQNQRRQDRVDCDIILNKFEQGAMNIVRATNLSLGGMRFRRLLEPQKDQTDKVRFEMELPGGGEPLMIGAQRVYESEEFVGVRFTDISHGHFLKLRNWLQSRAIEAALPMFP